MSWQTKSVGECLAKVRRPGKLQTKDYQAKGAFPIIDQGEREVAGFTDSIDVVIHEPLPLVIFGDHTRRVKIATEPFACGADGTQLLYPNCPDIEPVFFYYAIKNIDLSNYFYARHFKFLKEQKLHFPDRSSQHRIADILSTYDDLIENNRRRIALLEEAARLLYREWFVHFRFPGHEHVKITDSLPEGWERRTISEIAGIYRGKSYKSSELVDHDGQPFINLKCFERGGGFRVSGLKWFKGAHKEHHRVEAGDIVIAVTDMTRDAMIVAQAARVPRSVGENAIYSMDVVKATPKVGIDPNWFYGMLRFSRFSAEVREEATGATVLHLKPKHIEGWSAIVPPRVLRELFSEQLGAILDQADNLELQNQQLAQARDLLLPRLMNGEIAV